MTTLERPSFPSIDALRGKQTQGLLQREGCGRDLGSSGTICTAHMRPPFFHAKESPGLDKITSILYIALPHHLQPSIVLLAVPIRFNMSNDDGYALLCLENPLLGTLRLR